MLCENDFTKEYITDSLYNTIIKELRTNSDGTPKQETGRKRELPRETLHNYLFFLSISGKYELASESAGIPEKRRRKYMNESETFRAVSNLAKNNVTLRSRMAVAQSIMGRKPSYYKLIHPVTQQPTYIELKEVPPNVNAAMWWLDKVDKIGVVEEDKGIPQLGAPRNEEEAQLLEMLLNRHYDYIKSKEQQVSSIR